MYLTSILWFVSLPVLIYISYWVILYFVKKYDSEK